MKIILDNPFTSFYQLLLGLSFESEENVDLGEGANVHVVVWIMLTGFFMLVLL